MEPMLPSFFESKGRFPMMLSTVEEQFLPIRMHLLLYSFRFSLSYRRLWGWSFHFQAFVWSSFIFNGVDTKPVHFSVFDKIAVPWCSREISPQLTSQSFAQCLLPLCGFLRRFTRPFPFQSTLRPAFGFASQFVPLSALPFLHSYG